MTGEHWRTARGCGATECVEVGSWRKSTSSTAGNCVEAGRGPGIVAVRDTKNRETGPVLEFPAGSWRAFTAALKAP